MAPVADPLKSAGKPAAGRGRVSFGRHDRCAGLGSPSPYRRRDIDLRLAKEQQAMQAVGGQR